MITISEGFISCNQVAKNYNISRSTFARWENTGLIVSHRVSPYNNQPKQYRISDVENLINKHSTEELFVHRYNKIEFRLEFMEKLGEKYGFKDNEDWYQLTCKHFYESGGRHIFQEYSIHIHFS